jgi:N-acetylmuramoyl-L-alanine amidase
MLRQSAARAFLPIFALGLLAGARPVSAEVGASGTRLVLPGGRVRAYMTYGHVDEPELYAPLLPELKRLGVTFKLKGDHCEVYYGPRKVAEWQVVRSREDLPETAEEPYVLVMGGNVFVPVRALAQRFSLDVKVQEKDNVVALVPLPVKPKPTAANPPLPPAAEPVTLQGVELKQGKRGLEVRVRTSAPVTPKWLTVKNPSPVRILLDFPNSHWADGVQLPGATGDVRGVRIGHPDPSTARLVLEVPSVDVTFTSVVVGADDVLATVGRGPQVRVATLDPETQKILEALKTRSTGKVTVSRGASDLPLDGPIVLDPSQPPIVPVDPPKPVIEHLKPLVVKPATSLFGKTIVLDAGHGGHDVGAKGLEYVEKDLCLKLCQTLQQQLEARGARVIMTRPSDTYVSLGERCVIANSSNADLFISIHLNSTPTRNSATGTETYWHTPQSQRLARALHRRVVSVVGSQDRGIRNRRFYVIRNTEMPSVLLEIGFINNKNDEALISQSQFQQNLAESLTLGVLDYFGTDL